MAGDACVQGIIHPHHSGSRENQGQPVPPAISMPQQLYLRAIGGRRHRGLGSSSTVCIEPQQYLQDDVQLSAVMYFDLRPVVPGLPHLGMRGHYVYSTGIHRSASMTQSIVVPAGTSKQTLKQLVRDSLKDYLLVSTTADAAAE